MKSKKKVAIFPAGSEIGLEIHDALKYSTFFETIGLSSCPSHADYVFSKSINSLPVYNEEGFIEQLNNVIKKEEIDYIYPAYDDIQLFLVENQVNIKATIVSAELRTVAICRSKKATYSVLQKFGFTPKTYLNSTEIKCYPVFLKPDKGQGSEGAIRIESQEQLGFFYDEDKHIVSEYLPGEEYTIDCYTDTRNKLLSCIMRKRKRIKNGISVSSEMIDMTPDITDMAQCINSTLSFRGAWFFQVKKNANGECKLLEVAPRIAGTMGVSRNVGINMPLLTLFLFEGKHIDIIHNKFRVSVDRALISRYQIDIDYSSVYLDLDDTVVVNGQINSFLMMFLYQQINYKKRVYLLTKHNCGVEEYLDKNHISRDLFYEIIHIDENEEKYRYIKNEGAIFIDDSFRERNAVSSMLEIPVFDVSEVECLVDWRL